MNELTLEDLIEQIQSENDEQRAAARDAAGVVGAQAVQPLAKIAANGDLEVARAANRAMQNIVYHAGRPGAGDEAKAVAAELLKLLGESQPVQLRRDVLWMTWQIAGEEAVESVAAFVGRRAIARRRTDGIRAPAWRKSHRRAASGFGHGRRRREAGLGPLATRPRRRHTRRTRPAIGAYQEDFRQTSGTLIFAKRPSDR